FVCVFFASIRGFFLCFPPFTFHLSPVTAHSLFAVRIRQTTYCRSLQACLFTAASKRSVSPDQTTILNHAQKGLSMPSRTRTRPAPQTSGRQPGTGRPR